MAKTKSSKNLKRLLSRKALPQKPHLVQPARLKVALDNIHQELLASEDGVARDAVEVSVLPVPLPSNGYSEHDLAFYTVLRESSLVESSGCCDCCGQPFSASGFAEPGAALLLIPQRPTRDWIAAFGVLCLGCASERSSGEEIVRWFLCEVFGAELANLVQPTNVWVAKQFSTATARLAVLQIGRGSRA